MVSLLERLFRSVKSPLKKATRFTVCFVCIECVISQFDLLVIQLVYIKGFLSENKVGINEFNNQYKCA